MGGLVGDGLHLDDELDPVVDRSGALLSVVGSERQLAKLDLREVLDLHDADPVVGSVVGETVAVVVDRDHMTGQELTEGEDVLSQALVCVLLPARDGFGRDVHVNSSLSLRGSR